MSLLSDYQARYSTELRTNWSNPQNSTATTPDTTRETLAAADAGADFSAICGVTYDSTNATHVTAGVTLVAARLLVYTGQASMEFYDSVLKRLETYKLVLGRNRITPTTNSTLTPTEETLGAAPWSDTLIFKDFIGNAPGPVSTVTDNPSNAQRD